MCDLTDLTLTLKWTTRSNRRCLKWIRNSKSGPQKSPKDKKSARDNYRSTEVTDLTLTFSDLQNVNGHCANVKSASCDPKQSISVSGQSAFISMWSNLQVSANLAGGCSLYDVITLWPDMTLTIFLTKSCAKDAPEGTENFSKLSQKVRRVAKKNHRGVHQPPPPPPARARVNSRTAGGLSHFRTAGGAHMCPPG